MWKLTVKDLPPLRFYYLIYIIILLTHCNLLPHICQDISVECQIDKRFVSFLCSLSRSRNSLVQMCYSVTLNGNLSPTSNNVSVISHRYNVPRENALNVKIEADLTVDDNALVRKSSFIRDVLQCLDSHMTMTSKEDFTDILHFLCTQWRFNLLLFSTSFIQITLCK